MKEEPYNHRDQERRMWNRWQNLGIKTFYNEQKKRPFKAILFWIKYYPSILPIIILNLIPILGVIFYNWEPLGIVGAFILETFVILYFSFL